MGSTEHALDISQPFSILLSDAVKEVHERASGPGAKLLLSGKLPKVQYTRFLMMLWHVYDALERALERHSTHPTLEPTYNPSLLGRIPSLTSDISYFLQVPVSTWQQHPLHTSLLASMPTQLRAYVDRINTIADSPDPSALLAHSYVRYLGDLGGGQLVRRVVEKAYKLDELSGIGVEFYEFKELGGSRRATQDDIKKIRGWFQESMNIGARDKVVQAAIMNEAKVAFELNIGLFEVIETMTTERTKSMPESESSGEEEPVLEVPLKALTSDESSERVYSVASVTAFIAAACLAHFIIVVGGLTGARGYQKLLAIERWFSTLF